MDSLFIAYRDPLFGAFVFALFLLFVSTVAAVAVRMKRHSEKRVIERFLQGFDRVKSEEYAASFREHPALTPAFEVLADIYSQKGEYEEAIKIYLALLDSLGAFEKKKRAELLCALGKAYSKAGFLARSAEILQSSLALFPRNPEGLRLWLALMQKRKEWDRVADAVLSLEELGCISVQEKSLLEALCAVGRQDTSNEQSREVLLRDAAACGPSARLALESFLASGDLELAKKAASYVEIGDCVDFLWYMPKDTLHQLFIGGSKAAAEVLCAKGESDVVVSFSALELDVMMRLGEGRNGLDLAFNHTCSSCGRQQPSYFYRCDICLASGSCVVEPQIVRQISFGELGAFA